MLRASYKLEIKPDLVKKTVLTQYDESQGTHLRYLLRSKIARVLEPWSGASSKGWTKSAPPGWNWVKIGQKFGSSIPA